MQEGAFNLRLGHCFVFKATKGTAPRLKLPSISVLKSTEDALSRALRG